LDKLLTASYSSDNINKNIFKRAQAGICVCWWEQEMKRINMVVIECFKVANQNENKCVLLMSVAKFVLLFF